MLSLAVWAFSLNRSRGSIVILSAVETAYLWLQRRNDRHSLEAHLSEELEKTNISVNTVDPGKLRTEMRRTAYPAEDSSTVPMPEEKSAAIVYLLSNLSPKMNGEQLTIAD